MRRVLTAAASMLLLAVVPAAAQQPVEFTGRVIDAESGEPVIEAVVRLPDLRRYTLTNEHGLFRLTGIRPGAHRVEVVQLGYAEAAATVMIDGSGPLTLRLPPQAIRLDEIVVNTSGRMDRTARERAQRMMSPLYTYDREAILASGATNPIEFLTGTAQLRIRECTGWVGADDRSLCLYPPFGGMGAGVLSNLSAPRDATGFGEQGGPRRGVAAALQRADMALSRSTVPMPAVTASGGRGAVFLDDRPLSGSLDELSRHTLDQIHRIETYGVRGERQIRLYTSGYLRLVALGAVQPAVDLLLDDEFQFHDWAEPDTLWPPR